MFYSEGNATIQYASRKGIRQVPLEIVIEEVLEECRKRDIIKQFEDFSHLYLMTLCNLALYNDTLRRTDFTPNNFFFNELDLLPN